MQTRHVPGIDRRYWLGIACASVFGTNLGDFYAHHSGLGIGAGVLVLLALLGITWAVEARDRAVHELYYWLAIIMLTGVAFVAMLTLWRGGYATRVLR